MAGSDTPSRLNEDVQVDAALLKRRKRRRKRLKGIRKFTGANIVSIAALILSGLSYSTSYQANRDAMLSTQTSVLTQYAKNVSYWSAESSGITSVSIQNLSNQPISSVMVEMDTASPEPHLPAGTPTLVGLGTITPCSVVTAEVTNIARLYLVGYMPGGSSRFDGPGTTHSLALATRRVVRFEDINKFQLKVVSLIFTDVAGRQWWRKNTGFFGDKLRGNLLALPYRGTAPLHDSSRRVGCA